MQTPDLTLSDTHEVSGMHEVVVERDFQCEAEPLWVLTSDFGGLQAWLPGVLGCVVEGAGAADNGGNAVRRVQLMDGSVTVESLDSFDQGARRYVYSILEAKGFDANSRFQASFQVEPTGPGHCRVIWSARFTLPEGLAPEKAAKARARIEQMYGFFLQHLQGVLAARR